MQNAGRVGEAHGVMCGIVAAYRRSREPVDPAVVKAMRDILTHRGPDDEGLLVKGHVGIGHRRLSIVDLTPAGRQPMANEDGTLWLVFNGEIYNYVELADELRARGHRFRSHTDSEVILHLYEEVGEACPTHLNGMFAFVIWDQKTDSIFAARDRFGIKPLHYHDGPDWFLCASEIKALLLHPAIQPTADVQGLADYLFAGHPLGRKTLFRDVRQLRPAQCLTLRQNRLDIRDYWRPQYRYAWDRPWNRTVAELADLMDDAVRIHCRSDAALGCHLSGGLDSSLVAALAARHRGELDTFSIRFHEGGPFDESVHARAVASRLGARHWEDDPGPDDLMATYATRMWHQDLPMPNAAGFTYYSASRLAVRHVKVALTGHGGDEAFAGYPAQFQVAFGSAAMFDLMTNGEPRPPGWLTRLRLAARREGTRGILERIVRRLKRAPAPGRWDSWIALHCGLEPVRNPVLDRRFRARLGDYTPRVEYIAPLQQAPTDEPLDQLLYHDLVVFLPSLLHHEDRASMAVSLESRVPLLDYRLIEFLATVPPNQKAQGLIPKALLRAVAQPLLPPSVVERRDKVPFPSPERFWLRDGLLPMIDTVLTEPRTLDRGVFAPDELRRGTLSPQATFIAFNVELWFRLFVDRDPSWLGLVERKQTRPIWRVAG
jgi:asparagine synthase (glutamine-hydrolysing)